METLVERHGKRVLLETRRGQISTPRQRRQAGQEAASSTFLCQLDRKLNWIDWSIPIETVERRDDATKSFPDFTRLVVGDIRNREVLGPIQERLQQLEVRIDDKA